MGKIYAILSNNKLRGIGNAELVDNYVLERGCDKFEVVDITKVYIKGTYLDYILEMHNVDNYSDVMIYSDIVLSKKEARELEGIVEAFLIEFKDVVDEIQTLSSAIKDESYKSIILDGIESVDSAIFNIYNTAVYIDEDLILSEIIEDYFYGDKK